MESRFTLLTDALKNIDNDVFIMGHINPDFDSIGSSVSLFLALKKLGKRAHILLDDNGIRLLRVCHREDLIPYVETTISAKNYSAIFVDGNTLDRIGVFKNVFSNAVTKFNIDHHEKNNILCDYKFVDEKASANCENVFFILRKLGLLDKEIAEFLFMGIVTDTNCFSIELDENTFTIANELRKYGISTSKIIKDVYSLKTLKSLKIQDKAMSLLEKGAIYYIVMDMQDNDFKDLSHNEIVSMVSNPSISYDGIDVIAVMQKFNDKTVIEFRSASEDTPVDEIARMLGGGGHKSASGCTILSNDINGIKRKIDNYFECKLSNNNETNEV